jgi:hypothetical protein
VRDADIDVREPVEGLDALEVLADEPVDDPARG